MKNVGHIFALAIMASSLCTTTLLAAEPGAATQPKIAEMAPAEEAALNKQLEDAALLIQQHRASEAMPIIDGVLAAEDKSHSDEKRRAYSARSATETLLYLAMGAKQKRDAVVFGRDWGLAYFLKGFVLIDLGAVDQAKPFLDKAVQLSPMNAQFLAEVGEWHKGHRDWANAYTFFERASTASEFSPDSEKGFEKRRGLRGMGFALSEQGKFDEAEALYRQCLKIDPNDAGAKSELQYIAQQRAHMKPAAS